MANASTPRMRHQTRALLAGATILLTGTSHAEQPPMPDVFERMRIASGAGSIDPASSLEITGTSLESDVAGTFRLSLASDGRYRWEQSSPLGTSNGFDGRTAWLVDTRGVPRTLELFDRDRWRLWAAFATGSWLHALPRSAMTVDPEKATESHVVIDLELGRARGSVHVNRSTWLPDSLTRETVSGIETWRFDSYRREAGRQLPALIATTTAGAADRFELTQAAIVALPDPSTYEKPPLAAPTDTHFDPEKSSRLELRRAPTGHVLVRAKVNRADLGWFIFDTGAGGATVLHTATADTVDLERIGIGHTTSIVGTVETPIGVVRSLEVGPMTIHRPIVTVMDLGFVRDAISPDIVGIVGYDVLSRALTEIVLAEDRIELHDPASAPIETDRWERLVFNQFVPVVPAAFEGGRGLFRIDVGAASDPAGNVIFHEPTVRSFDLLKDRDVVDVSAGSIRMAVGKIGWFDLAGHRFESPTVIFIRDPGGPLADPYVEGNMGVEFLKPFRILLDYRREQVAFIPL